jgi:formylmethanofuran dehydrogenase subunit E
LTSPEDATEFPPMKRTWGKPEARRSAECSQPPNRPMPDIPEEETFDLLKWRLNAQLECLLCIEMMMPPIVVCFNGHMICDNCRPKLDKCPLCRYSKPLLIRL